MEKEKWSVARKYLGQVEGIEEAPKECKDEASDLTAFIGALKLDAGPVVPQRVVRPPRPQQPTNQGPTKQVPSKTKGGYKPPINPYDS